VQYVSPIRPARIYRTESVESRQTVKSTREMEHVRNNRRRVSRAYADTKWAVRVECVKKIIYGRGIKHVWRKNIWTCHVARMNVVVMD
jgi:hypothetical protein